MHFSVTLKEILRNYFCLRKTYTALPLQSLLTLYSTFALFSDFLTVKNDKLCKLLVNMMRNPPQKKLS